jgi:hypothetical protein
MLILFLLDLFAFFCFLFFCALSYPFLHLERMGGVCGVLGSYGIGAVGCGILGGGEVSGLVAD